MFVGLFVGVLDVDSYPAQLFGVSYVVRVATR